MLVLVLGRYAQSLAIINARHRVVRYAANGAHLIALAMANSVAVGDISAAFVQSIRASEIDWCLHSIIR